MDGRFETYAATDGASPPGHPRRPDAGHRRLADAGVRGEQEGHRGQLPRTSSWRPPFADAFAPRGARSSSGDRRPNYFRKPFGPGGRWSATPATTRTSSPAMGISGRLPRRRALRHRLDEAFSGSASFETRWATTRPRATGRWCRCTSSPASSRPSSPAAGAAAAWGAVRNQEAMDGFARTMAGVTSPAEFFSEENVGQILAGTRWARSGGPHDERPHPPPPPPVPRPAPSARCHAHGLAAAGFIGYAVLFLVRNFTHELPGTRHRRGRGQRGQGPVQQFNPASTTTSSSAHRVVGVHRRHRAGRAAAGRRRRPRRQAWAWVARGRPRLVLGLAVRAARPLPVEPRHPGSPRARLPGDAGVRRWRAAVRQGPAGRQSGTGRTRAFPLVMAHETPGESRVRALPSPVCSARATNQGRPPKPLGIVVDAQLNSGMLDGSSPRFSSLCL